MRSTTSSTEDKAGNSLLRRTFSSVVKTGADLQKNPAVLSPLLTHLFPPGVVGAELRTAGDPALLLPAEAQHLGYAGAQRTQEFAAGRLCARRVLTEFGFADYPLPVSPDRRPHWPTSLVGSITHVSGMCGAVVASQRHYRAIGLDIAIVGDVTRDIWPYVCTAEELSWLAGLGESEQARCAALVFSVKEAFYKCQYGVTQQWLEFTDVTLAIPLSATRAGYFFVRPRRKIALLQHAALPWKGRFRFHANLVITGMVLDEH